jgi:actin-related protein
MFYREHPSHQLPSEYDPAIAMENQRAVESNNSYLCNESSYTQDDDPEEFEPDEDDEYGDSVPFDVPPLTGGPGTVYG